MGNPYTGATFFSFFLLLARRIGEWLGGKLPLSGLVTDEVQILVLATLAASGAMVGTFLLLRKMVMLANALSHTLLLGIVLTLLLAYWLSPLSVKGEWLPLPLLLFSAFFSGIATTFLTEMLHKVTRLQEDASIGLVFSLLFALGMVLVTAFSRNLHIGTELVMGNVDALKGEDVWEGLFILGMNLLLLLLFFPGLAVTTFDPQLARTLGFIPSFFTYLLMVQTSATAVGGFRAVGVLMVLAFFILPPLVAKLYTHRLLPFLAVSVGVGVGGALCGVVLSRHLLTVYGVGLSTAGVVVTLLGLLYLAALLVRYCRQRYFLLRGVS